jgi:phage shock protein E
MNIQQILSEGNPLIIDVREPWEYAQSHVPGAENIPLGNIPAHIDRFRNAGVPVVVYCMSGGRSGQAKAFLQQVGVPEVYNGGGIGEMFQLIGSFA